MNILQGKRTHQQFRLRTRMRDSSAIVVGADAREQGGEEDVGRRAAQTIIR